MDVLHSMQNFLRGRPKSFKTLDHAIEWRSVETGIQNIDWLFIYRCAELKTMRMDSKCTG